VIKLKKNKKTKLIIFLIALFIILIICGCLFIKPKRNDKTQELTNERAEQLIYNNYEYYVLSSGNMPLNGNVVYRNGVAYYGIDIKLKKITDIGDMLADTFSKEYNTTAIRIIYSDPNKKVIQSDDMLYANYAKEDENCKLEDIDLSRYKILKEHGKYYIQYRTDKYYQEVPVVYENGTWKLNSIIDFCL